MAFFISHVISTRDAHVSPRAEDPRANMTYNIELNICYCSNINNGINWAQVITTLYEMKNGI